MKAKRRLRKLEQRVARLETSTAADPTYDPQIPQPDLDPHTIWRTHVEDYTAGDPDEVWHHRGYL